MENLTIALKSAKQGSEILLGPGEFNQAGILLANDVTLRGTPGKTKIHTATLQGKAALIIGGENTLIEDIECFNIAVPHNNGACIRFEGRNLELNRVYFHDSQQGMLTGPNPGRILIRNSRFERLGLNGTAHGIYVGGGELYVYQSEFLRSKSQGMEIKSRARKTVIERSVIASLDGVDSRLLDIPNGGELFVKDSVLQQGNQTSNWNLIGFGLEGYTHEVNRIELVGNIILMERDGANKLLHIRDDKIVPLVINNVLVGPLIDLEYPDNMFFSDRKDAGIAPSPALPSISN